MLINGIDINIYEKYKKEIKYLKSIFNTMTNKWSGLKPESVKKVIVVIILKDGRRLYKEICYGIIDTIVERGG